jgi:hypothetical protein
VAVVIREPCRRLSRAAATKIQISLWRQQAEHANLLEYGTAGDPREARVGCKEFQ